MVSLYLVPVSTSRNSTMAKSFRLLSCCDVFCTIHCLPLKSKKSPFRSCPASVATPRLRTCIYMTYKRAHTRKRARVHTQIPTQTQKSTHARTRTRTHNEQANINTHARARKCSARECRKTSKHIDNNSEQTHVCTREHTSGSKVFFRAKRNLNLRFMVQIFLRPAQMHRAYTYKKHARSSTSNEQHTDIKYRNSYACMQMYILVHLFMHAHAETYF